ncbi:MAG: dUTP diphosphatase [Acidaminococcus intestini]|uniref:dUTP diphosphatase n=1 Tax=Acidaminococcus intestini TaxID=187327 RepID=A0A943EKM2_9FIRM|nr:dUTP diphosphatase [Acidaminococcus intestini]
MAETKTKGKPKATLRKPTAVKVKVKLLSPQAEVPAYKTEGAACFDIKTLEDIDLNTLNAYPKAYMVSTGLAFEIPEGYHMEVYLRSSVGLNTKLRLANGIGIIDSDYRGELKLIVENVSRFPLSIKAGTRIAQAMIVQDPKVAFEVVEELSESKRAEGGFGSTGEE